jgi:hypothetical protein
MDFFTLSHPPDTFEALGGQMFIFEDSINPRRWRTTDPGFNDALRSHLEKRTTSAVTEVYFQEVLEAANYCEHSYYEFGRGFDFRVYKKAKALCEREEIRGLWVGESGGGDD